MSPISLFYSYSHCDEHYRNELAKHLKLLERKGILTCWHDRRISPGNEWKGEIDENLKSADIILLLVSPDFIASDYCYDVELEHAMQRHNGGRARVIPVIIRPVNWHDAPFGMLQALPLDGKPVSTWENPDVAWTDVEKGIRFVIHEVTQSIDARHSTPSEPLSEEAVSNFSNIEQGLVSKNQAHSFDIREIELTIDVDFDKYTEQDKEQLLNAIASLLKIKDSELKIKKIQRGSTKITIELSAELAERLYTGIKAGELKRLRVIGVELKAQTVLNASDSESPGELTSEYLDELLSISNIEFNQIARDTVREMGLNEDRDEIEIEALVNETYLRLLANGPLPLQPRERLFAAAAMEMRKLLRILLKNRRRDKHSPAPPEERAADISGDVSSEKLIALLRKRKELSESQADLHPL